jgi:uncharacterized heparinase superfamily protein
MAFAAAINKDYNKLALSAMVFIVDIAVLQTSPCSRNMCAGGGEF